MDDCQELLREYGLCNVAMLSVECMSIEAVETMTKNDDISKTGPVKRPKKREDTPTFCDASTQTSLGLYRRRDGQFMVTRPRDLRERKTSAKQSARQLQRFLCYWAEKDIIKKITEVALRERVSGEWTTFCSLPYTFGISKSKGVCYID